MFVHRDCYRGDGQSKRRYQRRRDAKRAARRLGNGSHAYRCPVCSWWHTGHKPGR